MLKPTDITDDILFYEGELILLECGEYSDRFNTGLYRVKKPFSWRDMPAVGLYINRNSFHGDTVHRTRKMDKYFLETHLEPLHYYEINTDWLNDAEALTCKSENITLAEAAKISRMKLQTKS